jgi:hypothetical protein
VVLEEGRVHPLGGGKDLLAQVMLQRRPACEDVEHRGGHHRDAQEPGHKGLGHRLGGIVVPQAEGRDEGEGPHPARMVEGGLDGVGRSQARRRHHGLLPHHAGQEVRHQIEIALRPVGSGASPGASPAWQVGDEDAMALGQDLRRAPPLVGVMARAEGVEEEDRRAAAQLLEDHLEAGAARVAVGAAPAGSRGRLGTAA